jgi:hypothetical protein
MPTGTLSERCGLRIIQPLFPPITFWRDMLTAADGTGYDRVSEPSASRLPRVPYVLIEARLVPGDKGQVNFIIQRPAPHNQREKRIQSALEAWKANFEGSIHQSLISGLDFLNIVLNVKSVRPGTFRYETFNSLKVAVPQHLKVGNRQHIQDRAASR